MTEKFTEEQYQKIVELQKSQFHSNILANGMSEDECIWYYLSESESLLRDYIRKNDLYNETAAIFNPLTREWAHDKFVEKEKKYYWRTKKKNEQGKSLVLFHGAGGVVQMLGPEEPLTESEIKEWGFNPEAFDKKEVSQ